jgi:hypothetical protein
MNLGHEVVHLLVFLRVEDLLINAVAGFGAIRTTDEKGHDRHLGYDYARTLPG